MRLQNINSRNINLYFTNLINKNTKEGIIFGFYFPTHSFQIITLFTDELSELKIVVGIVTNLKQLIVDSILAVVFYS